MDVNKENSHQTIKKYTLAIVTALLGGVLVFAATNINSFFLNGESETTSNYVRDVWQDNNGYMWLGSINGLYRYDGYNKWLINYSDNDSRRLMQDSRIQAIKGWKDKYVWLRLRGRMYSCYDIAKDRFIDYTGDNTYAEPYRNFIITNDQSIWLFGNNSGCKRITESNGTFTSVKMTKDNGKVASDNIEFVEDGLNGQIWIGTGAGLVLFRDGSTTVLLKDKHFVGHVIVGKRDYFVTEEGMVYATTGDNGKKVVTMTSMIFDDIPPVKAVAATTQSIFIATEGPTYEYSIATHQITQSTTMDVYDGLLKYDNKGNRIIYSPDGNIWYFRQGSKQPIHLQGIFSAELLRLNSDPHFGFVTDNEGKIWISTFGNGVISYNPETDQYRHFLSNDNNSLLHTDYLNNLYLDRSGNIWVCQEFMEPTCLSQDGFDYDVRYFTEDAANDHRNIIRLIKSIDAGRQILVANMYNGLKWADSELNIKGEYGHFDDDVLTLETDKNGVIWYGTRNNGIIVGSKNYRHDKNNANSLGEGKISDIYCDNKGRMWITLFDSGVDLAVPDGNGGYTFRHFLTKKEKINQPRSIVQDHAGFIWISTSQGVVLFHPDKLISNGNDFRQISVNKDNPKSDEIHCLFEDKNNRMWIGTIGKGVVIYDNTHGGKPVEEKHLTTNDGLSNNNVQLISDDNDGNIWIGTDNGLSQYRHQEDKLYNFYMSNHSLENMFTENCAFKLNDGRMAFGTRHGILLFNPHDAKARKPQFALKVTDLYVNGVSVRDMGKDSPVSESLDNIKRVELKHDQNSLTFFFSDFNYTKKHNTKYSCLLENYDDEWSPLSNVYFVTYRNLPVGTYKLHIRSYSSNGELNEKSDALIITILPPIWATWWAYLIYLLFLAAIVFHVYHHFKRINDLRNQVKVENQLTEYKLRFFTNISHEFRTPLTIIKGAMERINAVDNIPGEMRQPVSSMRKSVERMLRLINQLLEFRRMQNDKLKLRLEKTDVIAFVKEIFLTFWETAENKNINYIFQPFAKQHEMFIDKGFVDKIIYNLLSNAFKYTPSNHQILLHIARSEGNEEGNIVIEVADTGIGISKEKQGDLFTRFNQSTYAHDSIGIGLHLVQELVHVHHGTIEYRENPEGGSIFVVTLPDNTTVYDEKDFITDENPLVAEEEVNTSNSSRMAYRETVSEPLNNQRVLVVEDDSDVSEFVKGEMQQYFTIETASNGQDALEKARAIKPDLIVSDVMMPVMNGFELTQAIRADENLSDTPIILLTALSAEAKKIKGIKSGADAYIEKPFSVKVLIAQCCQLLEQRNQLKRQYAKEVVDKAPLPEIITEEQDRKFRNLLDTWLSSHISDPNLSIDTFAEKMGYGRTTFFKKVKTITGQTPNDYIRSLRMNKAAELLKDDKLTVAEAAYQVGMNDQYYFSKCFKTFFGTTPTKYRKGKSENDN